MADQDLYFRWEWQLRSTPENFWPFIADTNRFNFDRGNNGLQVPASAQSRQPNARRILRLTTPMGQLDYAEEPFEWVRPYRYGVNRRFTNGPIAEMRLLAELKPTPTGAQFIQETWVKPSSWLARLILPIAFGSPTFDPFDKAIRRYDELASQARPPVAAFELAPPAQLSAAGKERLALLQQKLLEQNTDADLVNRLTHFIETADDLTVARFRPYTLADYWHKPRRAVLELCLFATRVGLLDFRWELLCPLCRGAQDSPNSLGNIKAQVHCDTCNIDFQVNFERSVELTFRPNPSIRTSVESKFCVGGPQVTPHIAAQQLLPPGTQRTITLPLEVGRYRVRTLEQRGSQTVIAAPNGQTEATITIANAWPDAEILVSPLPSLHLHNVSTTDQLFILERMAWNEQAVTAAEVTTSQVFRDLFATEALRPGESISVGSLSVIFTDLRDSTRMYRQVGDAVAFGRVMSHFDVLREVILANNGAIVKTIGDAVMAVFTRPVAAVRALLEAQRQLALPPAGGVPLQLKAGVNYGPCIAVTLNDRLDYFGSTVNLAARLEGQSAAGGIVLSPAVRHDPEVARYLTVTTDRLTLEAFTTKIKGFEEDFELWRVTQTPVAEPLPPLPE